MYTFIPMAVATETLGPQQFLPRDAVHKRGLCRRAVSVRLSICPSVCHNQQWGTPFCERRWKAYFSSLNRTSREHLPVPASLCQCSSNSSVLSLWNVLRTLRLSYSRSSISVLTICFKPRHLYYYWLVAWHSDRTLVFDRRTFPVLRSTNSWRVITYVGKPSAVGQPTRPTQPFILSR